MIVLFNVDGSGAIRRVGPVTGRLGVRKGHRAKVGKGGKTPTLFEIFDNPLCVLLAKRESRIKTLGHRLSTGQILDCGVTRRRGRSCDGEFDNISTRDVDACEIVGRGGVPLVPSYSQTNSKTGNGYI